MKTIKYSILSLFIIITSSLNAQLGIEEFYYVTDGGDDLYVIDLDYSSTPSSPTNTYYGDMGTGNDDIEAIAFWPSASGGTLYATDGGIFGIINTTSGSNDSRFTPIGQVDGGGTASGSAGNQSLNDVDGLAFDPQTGILWATNRRGLYDDGNPDLIFQIDPTTGLFVEDAFGPGIDYVVLSGQSVYEDIDDIAISPVTGDMYAVSNEGGTTDQLLKINKNTGVIQVVNDFPTGLRKVEGFACNNAGDYFITTGSTSGSYSRANRIFHIDVSNATIIDSASIHASDVEGIACLLAPINTITGTVFDDEDENLVQNGSEPGLSGVTVELYRDNNQNSVIDAGDKLLQTTTTDANGDYEFTYATIGYLCLQVDGTTVPVNYAFTTDNIETAVFTDDVNFGETDTVNDFGLVEQTSSCSGGGPAVIIGSNSIDSDGDGVNDACDLDSDNDGILDEDETITDTDNDGIQDYLDLDSDNDGIPDAYEANYGQAPTGYSSLTGRITGADTDGDGLLDNIDDAPSTIYGSSASTLPYPDTDGDNVKDNRDKDSDNDGIMDCTEANGTDSNGDGIIDSFDDSNSDGYDDDLATTPLSVPNTDLAQETNDSWNARPDYIDVDSDADGIDDTREGLATYGIDVPCYGEPSIIIDTDGDGVIDYWDSEYDGTAIDPYDKDGDLTPDFRDTDTDDEGEDDIIEGNDSNHDDIADSSPSGVDSDGDGIDDNFEDNVGTYGGYTNYPLQNEDADGDVDWRDDEIDDNPLPISLLDFTAELTKNNKVILKWTTASEVNNKGFVIEKSNDAENFHPISWVDGLRSSNQLQNYQIYDNSLTKATTFYRLKQMDFDGKSNYSEIAVVRIDNQINININAYPNPFDNYFNIEISTSFESTVEVSVYNYQGQIVVSKIEKLNRGSNILYISELKGLNKGLYTIRIQNDNNINEIVNILKK